MNNKEMIITNSERVEEDIIVPSIYIVKKEDTIYSIAKKYNIPWQLIYKKNKNVIGEKPYIIKPGQVLFI